MQTEEILIALRNQRDRLNAAISALEGSTGTRSGRTALARGTNVDRRMVGEGTVGNGRRGKRRMSAAARKKISIAAKARWARWKKRQ
jgi:hypothetical protein